MRTSLCGGTVSAAMAGLDTLKAGLAGATWSEGLSSKGGQWALDWKMIPQNELAR